MLLPRNRLLPSENIRRGDVLAFASHKAAAARSCATDPGSRLLGEPPAQQRFGLRAGNADPELLEPTQRDADRLKIVRSEFSLRQHLEMTLMHRCQAVPQLAPLFGEMNVDRAAVVQRALLHEIAVLDHLLDIVRDVRTEIAAPQCQFADGHFGITNAK